MSLEQFEPVYTTKVTGIKNLHNILSPDIWVLFSSIAWLFGTPGQ